MKNLVKKILPVAVLNAYRRMRRIAEANRNGSLTPREVFSEVYRKSIWGSDGSRFYSGTGSADQAITAPYVTCVREILSERYAGRARVVDLGCGDFVVGRQLTTACAKYVAVDVVPELVQHLRSSCDYPNVEFECLDITRDPLPDGDVCLVRQVLQHLSNQQISEVLGKLGKYDLVIVTEHYPSRADGVQMNLDKIHGGDTRLLENSGVYLNEAPYNVPNDAIVEELEVCGHDEGGGTDPGVIRTFSIQGKCIPSAATVV